MKFSFIVSLTICFTTAILANYPQSILSYLFKCLSSGSILFITFAVFLKTNRNFIETYTITLTKGFAGDSTSIFINDSLLVNRTMTEEPFILEVKRFAEQSALMIVNNATEKLSLFELSEKGGEYRFEKEGEEVKQLAQE